MPGHRGSIVRAVRPPGGRRVRDYLRVAPLWLLGRATSGLRANPSFIIIGAQKAGTTSLFRYLAGHPHVIPALRKEVHFFDLHYSRGTGWYRAHFPARAHLERLTDVTGSRHVTGEASPLYLLHPLAPLRVAEVVPDAKFVVLLRDPIQRALSHYEHERRAGREHLDVGSALAAEEERLKGEIERVNADTSYYSKALHRFSYLARGRYAEQLARWFRIFPREQFLIIESERMFEDPNGCFQEVQSFLGLESVRLHKYDAYNVGSGRDRKQLDQRIWSWLDEYFRPHNEELMQLLGKKMRWIR